jgi:protein-S-isoprenylcysteine O-methyltransferase Ste14
MGIRKKDFIKRFKEWTQKPYSRRQRLAVIVLGGILFWIVLPSVIIIGSTYLDAWLSLPRFVYGRLNTIIGLLFIGAGWLFANWTVKVQFSLGGGTPIPLMPPQELVIKRPYTYCRNPMALGTTIFFLGIAIWLGSVSALGLALIYPIGISIYIKSIEEKELEERFGSEYSEYKKRTPFLIPRIWKRESEEVCKQRNI